jgi:hypothetical protein
MTEPTIPPELVERVRDLHSEHKSGWCRCGRRPGEDPYSAQRRHAHETSWRSISALVALKFGVDPVRLERAARGQDAEASQGAGGEPAAVPKRRGRPPVLSLDAKVASIRRHDLGERWSAIAADLGVPESTLVRECRRLRSAQRFRDAIAAIDVNLDDLEESHSTDDSAEGKP